ncbi:MAG TPA: VCBS repeat-containing protein [Labilithrix sp.]|nr:VCBS repeat-containing protein [Labilithrix sp.]
MRASLILVSVLAALVAASCGEGNDAQPGANPLPDGSTSGSEGGPGADGGQQAEPHTPGERFELTTTKYPVPTGGIGLYGFAFRSRQNGYENERDEFWVLEDMTGDGVPDLVITTVIREVRGTASVDQLYDETFGYPSAPHWRVHTGSADGFALNYVTWGLPASGGRVGRGYHRATNQTYVDRAENERGVPNKEGDEAWTLQDMDGDGRPDLVVTGAAAQLDKVGYVFRVFDHDSTPVWKVYRNNGAGFDTTAERWPVPKTPVWNTFAGLAAPSSMMPWDYTTHYWDLRDIDGDKRPDLVVYATVEKNPDSSYRVRVPGHPTTPHWEVYRNDGHGFAATPTSWPLPKQRGHGDEGLSGPTRVGIYEGDNAWTLLDMDGDGRQDLVVSAVRSRTMKALGYPSESHWEVYRNDGTRFDPVFSKWRLPRGGTSNGGFPEVASSVASVAGDDVWSTVDIDGDSKPDLVVTGEFKDGTKPGIYNLGRSANDSHWMVYRNGGQGFADEGKRWDLPNNGGLREVGFITTAGAGAKVGDEGWALFDLTGDKQPELVRLHTSIQDPRRPGIADATIPQVSGFGAGPHWLVHRNVP